MESLQSLFEALTFECNYHYEEYPVALPLAVFMIIAFIILVICRLRVSSPKEITNEIKRELRNKVDDVKDFVGVGTRPRFRKRDKIYFYGRKMLRKVKANIQIRPERSKQLAKRIARKFLGRPDRDITQLQVIEPPAEYMQEDLMILESSLPNEFLIMLKTLRVFGQFDMPLFIELCKRLETLNLTKGQTLFQIGEMDENIFIVQTGRVRVYINDENGVHDLKDVPSGEAIISLLSFCDVLTGQPQPYKTISAKAMEDSVVMKFPVKAFEEIFKSRQHMIVRMVQTVMVRLMRVTFTALHNYLGLSAELLKRNPRRQSIATTSVPSRTHLDSGTMHSDPEGATSERVNHDINGDGQEKEVKPPKKIVLVDPNDDEESILELATEKFKALLHLDSDENLRGHVQVKDVDCNEVIMKQDCLEHTALVYILDGLLMVSQESDESGKKVQLFLAQPGDIVGALSVLSADPSFYTVEAMLQSRVATISKETFFGIMKQTPDVVLHVAKTVLLRMSPFVRQIDFALDWEHLEAGRALYRQGEVSDSTFIVLNGRLRSIITHANGRKEVVGEYAKGDLVGIVELLTQTERHTTVMAIRDSELAKLPEGLFNFIKMKHPAVVTRLIKLLGQRILGTWKCTSRDPINFKINNQSAKSNYSTVAIVPISEDVPFSQFTLELHHSLLSIDNAARLTSDLVVKSLGTSVWEGANECHLISWLSQIEDKNRITLYQCDSSLTVWTKRCIRQADVILTVGLAQNEPSVGKIEKHVEAMAIRTQKLLVLLHREDASRPTGTVRWLNMRSWCHSHHHIKAPKRVFVKRAHAKLIDYYTEKVFCHPANIHSDFSRLARFLTGTSIGLVLGGGGARGAAHIGMIKAFEEAGVPIDMVGGVSIGAFFGALVCLENNLTRVTQKAREFSIKMTSKWRMIVDLTYPMVSMFTGASFNTLIREALGDTNIEDLWLPYFTLTTDITDSCARIHTHGCAWQYVRASMSLAMLIPPFPDPTDSHLLMDGCYINNVPADIMRNRWNIGNIIAIDVGSQYDSQFTNYGDTLSGFNLLLRTTKPFKYFFRSDFKVPNLYDIQTRLSYVSCMRQLEELKASDYCEYIRPPIDEFHTLNFGAFDDIKDIGYQHGKKFLDDLVASRGTVEDVYKFKSNRPADHIAAAASGLSSCSYEFTDLSYLVCQESGLHNSHLYESSDDYTQSGYASEPNTSSTHYNQSRQELLPLRTMRTGSLSENDFLDYDRDEDEDDETDSQGEEDLLHIHPDL